MTAEHSKPAEDAAQAAERLRSALLGASVRGDSAALDAVIRESATSTVCD